MTHKVVGRLFAAVAVGAMMTASFAGVADAAVVMPMHQQQGRDGNDWRGRGAPAGTDRHCDSRGFWHNNDNDRAGHRDGRCRAW